MTAELSVLYEGSTVFFLQSYYTTHAADALSSGSPLRRR